MNEKIILGTVQLGLPYGINNVFGKPTQEESLQILKTAYSSGVRFLDTAEAYGNAIEMIGLYHKDQSSFFEIISKFGAINVETDLKKNITESLHKLNVSSIYAYLFHSPADLQQLNSFPKLVSQLQNIKKEGLVKKIGVSIYNNEDFKLAIENPLIEIIQFPYNVLDNNNKRLELLKYAKDIGKELHCRSVFLQGLFYKDTNSLPIKLSPLKQYLDTFNSIANDMKISTAELAFNYALKNPYIDKVLIGVDSAKQLIENLKMTESKVTLQDLGIIDKNINVKEEELLYPYNWN